MDSPQTANPPTINYRDHWVWLIMVFGFCLMFGTIYLAETINFHLAKPEPAQVATRTQTSLPISSALTNPSLSLEAELQVILNDPVNFYQPQTIPSPAQQIIDGHGVEFLIGL